MSTPSKTPQPRPHQVAALTDLTTALAVHDRTQLVMACGTGKTFVGRWHAQASDAEQVLVLLPSLALVAQTLREWRRATGSMTTGWRFRALVVCSDPTTTAGVAERHAGDDELELDGEVWDQTGARVTTDPTVAARFLRDHQPGRPQVIFSTYHSSAVVAAAQRASATRFDLALCDEAHRLAGRPSDAFLTILDDDRISARKRVFMTATPKPFAGEGGTSMDDRELFGPVAHTVTFGDAISAGLLTDYQVLVVAGHAPDGARAGDPASTVPGALVQAIDNHQLRRVLSFHGRVAKAEAFASHLDGRITPAGHRVEARHVAGSMPTNRRVRALEWLGGDGGGVRLVSNARCLSEGVDVPAVDGILFADQRSSVVDIIQAIGRVLRPSPGKTRGTIILPVTLPDDGDDDTTLALSAFTHVWTVLRGLRAHDQRLGDELDAATAEYAKREHGGGGGFRIPRVEFVFPDGITIPDLQLRAVQEIGSMWERNYQLLLQWAERHDGKLLPRGAKSLDGSISLGEWAEQLRLAHRRGLVDPDRAARLEEIPGWSWDKEETRWRDTIAVLAAYAAEHGTVADHQEGVSRFAGMKDCEAPRRNLGVWMATQRQAYRFGTLTDERTELLEQLPGWSWDGHLPAGDVEMVEALRQFVEFEKHAVVPDDHVEDGLRLGAWCWAVRRRRLNDRLSPVLLDEILAATPSKFLSHAKFQWETAETQWRLGYFALRQYMAREGKPPTGHTSERLPDAEVNIGAWTALQRLKKRRGELDERHLALLEAVPGWLWEIDLHRVDAQEPVDLPPSCQHGAAGAYQTHNCRCLECLTWKRTSDRERLAEKRRPKHPVSATRARRHLRAIEQGFLSEDPTGNRNGRSLMAGISGVSLGTIRKVLNGETDFLEREHEARLMAVTLDVCMKARGQIGSRGRATSSLTSKVDSGPTWELIDDLASRGFGITWISRECGYTTAVQLRRGRPVSGRIATAVKRVHDEVGDLAMPDLPKSVRRPSLAELKGGWQYEAAS